MQPNAGARCCTCLSTSNIASHIIIACSIRKPRFVNCLLWFTFTGQTSPSNVDTTAIVVWILAVCCLLALGGAGLAWWKLKGSKATNAAARSNERREKVGTIGMLWVVWLFFFKKNPTKKKKELALDSSALGSTGIVKCISLGDWSYFYLGYDSLDVRSSSTHKC